MNCCEKCDVGTITNPECDNPLCECHAGRYGVYPKLSQSKKEEDVRDFVGQFVRHKCGKECTGCSADVDAIIERVRAADRAALIRAVEGMKKSEFGDKDKPFYGTGIARRFSYAYNAALDDVLALLHSPEK